MHMTQARRMPSRRHPATATAVELAKLQIVGEVLTGRRDEDGDVQYPVAQGAKAAVFGREDAAATLMIQNEVLVKLDSIKRLAWVCVALLVIIAFRMN